MLSFVKKKFLKYVYILPIAAPILVLIKLCIINSSKRYLWFDELVTYYLVTDNSFFHMLKALSDGVDTAPPFYFMVSWLWVKLFGGTVLSIRMISSIGFCTACFIVYIVLYRVYKFWPAFIGTIAVFLGSNLIYRYNCEARCYGLFMAIVALAVFLYYKVCTTTVPSKKILILMVLTHAAMVLTHYYGFIYSAMIFFALLIRDKYLGLSRRKIYLSIVLGWLMFIPWIFSFIKQLNIIKDDFWVKPPYFYALINIYGFEIRGLMLILIAIFIVLFISLWKDNSQGSAIKPIHKIDQNQKITAISILLLVSALLIIPGLSWLFSNIIRPFFVKRYFIPTGIAHAFIIAALVSVVLKYPSRLHFTKNIVLVIISAVLLFLPLIRAKSKPVGKMPCLDTSMHEYPELPIVSAGYHSDAVEFLPHIFLRKRPWEIYLSFG